MAYFRMNSGRLIDIESISEKDISILDIAHHLTKICRYGGSLPLNQHYSVAQHSIHLVEYSRNLNLSLNLQKALLLHDATEAYIGDIVRGLKHLLPEYISIENRLSNIIYHKYGVEFNGETQEVVKSLDTRIVLDEAMEFFPLDYDVFVSQVNTNQPLGINIDNSMSEKEVKTQFLLCCQILGIRD